VTRYIWNTGARILDADGVFSVLLVRERTGFAAMGTAAEALALLHGALHGRTDAVDRSFLRSTLVRVVPEEDLEQLITQLVQRAILLEALPPAQEEAGVGVCFIGLNGDCRALVTAVTSGPLPAGLAVTDVRHGHEAASRAGDSDADLTVLVDHAGDDALVARAGRAMALARRPYLPVQMLAGRVRLGPLSLPGDSACFRCSLDRAYTNRGIPGQFMDAAPAGASPGATGRDRAFDELCAAALLGPELRAFAEGPLATRSLGRMIEFDAASLSIRHSPVVQSPVCDDCRVATRAGA
jgi:bacteriocin biosynthesis cyclodehydratase domain-containing protein